MGTENSGIFDTRSVLLYWRLVCTCWDVVQEIGRFPIKYMRFSKTIEAFVDQLLRPCPGSKLVSY